MFYVCYFYASHSFTFSFVNQLQTAENTIFLLTENIFHNGLDGTMILYVTNGTLFPSLGLWSKVVHLRGNMLVPCQTQALSELQLSASCVYTAAEQETTAAQQETTAAQQETTAAQQDTTAAQQDTTAAQQETTAAQQETTAAQQDTTAAEQDTTAAEQETTAAQQETTAAQQETTAAQQETTAAQQETTAAQRVSWNYCNQKERLLHFLKTSNFIM
jgi:flagellar biosynthesis GTPase FlhF